MMALGTSWVDGVDRKENLLRDMMWEKEYMYVTMIDCRSLLNGRPSGVTPDDLPRIRRGGAPPWICNSVL